MIGVGIDGLVVVLLALAAMQVALHHELWRGMLVRWEDPRTIALFRIAWGSCALYWVADLVPLHEYLFSDEGLYSTEAAREAFAAAAFAGYGDASSPDATPGFFDAAAFLQWVGHPRRSLLFFWDSPAAVRVHFAALSGAILAVTLGLWTRASKWIALLLFWSTVDRNSIFWAGEQIFLSFGFLLCLSRCGHAYSVDEWRRARAAKREGREAHSRPIPAWPRVLAMLQVLPLMAANGLAKSGRQWAEGDVLHYLLANPEFSRFDPSSTSASLSTTLFPILTRMVHGLEILYPLVFVGVVLSFSRRSGVSVPSGWRRRLARATWAAIACIWIAITLELFAGRDHATLSFVLPFAAACVVLLLALVGIRRDSIPSGLTCWLLGRRTWLTAQALFMVTLWVTCDIGAFVLLSCATTIVFFEGHEVAIALARMRGRRATSASQNIETDPRPDLRRDAAVLWFTAFHIVAVALVCLPRAEPRTEWRRRLERPLRSWIEQVHTLQFWRMFAPNGSPRRWTELSSIVETVGGARIEMDAGIPGLTHGQSGLGRAKARKTETHITDDDPQTYAVWHARFLCRRWALDHGELPRRVVLVRTRRPILPPNAVHLDDVERAELVEARTEREEFLETDCDVEIEAQLSPEIRSRHGIPRAQDRETFRPLRADRETSWPLARAAGEVPVLPWSLVIVGAPLLALVLLRQRKH